MKTVIFIQARLGGSTRLGKPKIMQILKDKTVLEHVYNRCKQVSNVDDVYCVIPDDEPELEIFCIKKDIKFLTGDHDNVLERFYTCAKVLNVDNIVRITADCFAISPLIIEIIVKKHIEYNHDYTANNFFNNCTMINGMDTEVIKFECLEKVRKLATGKHLQHVTSYIRELENRNKFKCGVIETLNDYSHLRLTLDYTEDLELAKILYNELYNEDYLFDYRDIINLYQLKPEIFNINKMYSRDYSYFKDK